VLKETQAHKVFLVLLVIPEILVLKEIKVKKVTKDHKDL
jgi:hypothetical protein